MADAHEAAVALARQRWGNTVVRSAVATVVARRDELDDALKADLDAALKADPRDGDDAR